MSPKDILLNLQTRVLLIHRQRSFPTAVDGNKHRNSQGDNGKYALSERPLNTQFEIRCLHKISPLRTQGTLQKRKKKDCKSQRRRVSLRKQGLLDTIGMMSHMNSQTVAACTGPAQF